jgi:hypothetical protein
MSRICDVLRVILLSGELVSFAAGVEFFEDLEGEAWVKAHSEAAEKEFAVWKATGKEPEGLFEHVQRGDRQDLWQRKISGDRLAETEIKTELAVTKLEVAVHDRMPAVFTKDEGMSYPRVWRRITKDRFEIWSPAEGKLYDAKGRKIATAKVSRGSGWGREWYGAFLSDGRWVTTDLEELDCRLTMFSIKGQRISSIKGNQLIPAKPDVAPLPLIGWARSDQSGKAWIVSVGSEAGRGWVRVTPDGKWSRVECPWTECFPQQLGKRGFYIDLKTMSDDGKTVVSRREAGHGIGVGWPTYEFPGGVSETIPDGGKFGILPGGWTVFIESWSDGLVLDLAQRENEAVWFFESSGNYQRWARGRGIGASLKNGGLWIRLLDETSILIDKNHLVKARCAFATKDQQSLVPVEIHDDIGLGLFLEHGEGEDGDQLVVGTWTVQ